MMSPNQLISVIARHRRRRHIARLQISLNMQIVTIKQFMLRPERSLIYISQLNFPLSQIANIRTPRHCSVPTNTPTASTIEIQFGLFCKQV